MDNFIDYYSILEKSTNATDEQIRTAFKIQSLRWHPDRNPGIDTHTRMQLINEARRILLDAALKLEYDVGHKRYKEQTAQDNEDDSPYEPWEPYEYRNSIVDDVCLKELYKNTIKEKTDKELTSIISNVYKYNSAYVNLVVTELIIRKHDPEKIDGIINRQRQPVIEKDLKTTDKFDLSWLWVYLLFCLAGYLAHATN